jgi:4-hydroxybenzoate polyprenyltransferase
VPSNETHISKDSTDARSGSTGSQASLSKPLCVDLDGALIRTDLRAEALLSLASQKNGLTKLLLRLLPGAASARESAYEGLNVRALPYNKELLSFLREQRANGRRIVLATSADEHVARAIANHLGFRDEAILSYGKRHPGASDKAQDLVRHFGFKGFDYAGVGRADLEAWRQADRIVLVNATSSDASLARSVGPILGEFDRAQPALLAAVKAMRPHQWVKNLLVFVPIIASRSFLDVPGLIGAACMFASFCATASGIYLINDLFDVEADRAHPRKRQRPLASGVLSAKFCSLLAVALLALGSVLAFSVGASTLLLLYVLTSIFYSVLLKKFPLVDIFILAALYTMRVIAGGVASGHHTTLWLLAFSGFTFFSLALIKRTGELIHMRNAHAEAAIARRGYRTSVIGILEAFGIASAFASSVVLALFISSTAAVEHYQSSELLWGSVPLILFWQLRLWLATDRGNMQDDPIVYAARDWVSWLVAACTVAIVLLASWDLRIW